MVRYAIIAGSLAGMIAASGCSPCDPFRSPACPVDADEIPVVVGPPPQGADHAPTLEELLDAQSALESTTLTITGSGDVATFSDGFVIEVAAGALPAGTELLLQRYGFSGAPGDSAGDLYRINADVQPISPVLVTMPLPPAYDDTQPDAYTLWFHDDGELEPINGVVAEATRTITVSLDRFSVGLPHVVAPFDATPAPYAVVDAPFYDQGDTDNCWSVALTMLLNAYGADTNEVWHNNAFFGINAEDGLPFDAFLVTDTIVDHIHQYLPGVTVERRRWMVDWIGGEKEALFEYLSRQAQLGRPTMLWVNSPYAHMLLLVGYDGDEFVYHDPTVGGFTRATWDELLPRFDIENVLGFKTRAGTGTLAIAADPPASSRAASVNVDDCQGTNANGPFMLRRKKNGRLDGESTRMFRWYLETPRRHGWQSHTGAPASIDYDHIFYPRFRVANHAFASPAMQLTAGFEVRADNAVIHRSDGQTSSAPGIMVGVPSLAAGVPLRAILPEPGSYQFTFFVEQAGVRHDEASIDVVVEASSGTGQGEPPLCMLEQRLSDGSTWVLNPDKFNEDGTLESSAAQSECSVGSGPGDCDYGFVYECEYVDAALSDSFDLQIEIAFIGGQVPVASCESIAEASRSEDIASFGSLCEDNACSYVSATRYVRVATYINVPPPVPENLAALAINANQLIALLEPYAQPCP